MKGEPKRTKGGRKEEVVRIAETAGVVPAWQTTFGGREWWQMPGVDSDMRKLNFAMLRRGLIRLEEIQVEDEETGEVVTVQVTYDAEGARQNPQLRLHNKKQQLAAALKEKKQGGAVKMVERVFLPESLKRKRERQLRREAEKRRAENLVLPAEQVAVVEHYKALVGQCNKLEGPRQIVMAAAKELGMLPHRVEHLLAGLAVTKAGELEVLRSGVEALGRWIQERDARRGRLEHLLKQARLHGAYGVDVQRRLGVSGQIMTDLRKGKVRLVGVKLRELERLLEEQLKRRAAA